MCRPGAGLWLSEAIGDARHGEYFIGGGSLTPLPPSGYDNLGSRNVSILVKKAQNRIYI